MGSIQDLLNPLPEGSHVGYSRGSRNSTSAPRYREKRSRAPKDGPMFRPGNPHGEIRFPPYEAHDEELIEIHQKWNLYPMYQIADYPRQIPYASDKKSFQERTGRDSFHVFNYTFQVPDDKGDTKTTWTIMWDYNIGLVRTTPLFKCNDYSKTAPGKALASNPGLREICHSITGGALAAQGYWMPYEAAKAVAATFCWKIRYALTPLFGNDFPNMCVDPQDRLNFARMVIDPEIIRRAAETAIHFRSLELQKAPSVSDNPSSSSSTSGINRSNTEAGLWDGPTLHISNKLSRRTYADSISSTRGSSSEPSYCASPQSPMHGGFTPVNAPRSSRTEYLQDFQSPRGFLEWARSSHKKSLSDGSRAENELDTTVIQPKKAPSSNSSDGNGDIKMDESSTTRHKRVTPRHFDMSSSDDEDSMDEDGGEEDEEEYEPNSKELKRPDLRQKRQLKKNPSRSARAKCRENTPVSSHFVHEVKAAQALLHLHKQEAKSSNSDGDEPMNEPVWSSLRSRSMVSREGEKKRCASF
ncbi:APSES transcription factor Xbp1 [Penicillium taxi]|uniref:APSES transcription factor Xbp1 n=1 Tax=Penicillium taxi TaxID=168475 RepID=UPI0025452D28|nr:APSES transcription factor Xbp1 [Penicillium taxi]KAJ5884687.1 APSES transcription factor Xbp1 [Penicillium taxi]